MNESILMMRTELLITAGIFGLLFMKLGNLRRNGLILLIIALLLMISGVVTLAGPAEGKLFASLFISNPVIRIEKSILCFAAGLLIMLHYEWLKSSAQLAEFLLLMLSAMLGMFFMLSSGSLLMFYLGLELSTIPVAALANFDLDKRRSGEAAMKMILSSALASGIMLFGISFIYGAAGTIQFAELATHWPVGSFTGLMGFILFLTAFLFKLSVVPFHLWTADVYEGSPLAVTSFLSVISKSAFAFALMRVVYEVYPSLHDQAVNMLVLLMLLTIVIGNLFALRQQNMKRFLAYSSISQVGFILLAVIAGPKMGLPAMIFFIIIYAFSNLAAFGVLAAVTTANGKERIEEMNGFYVNNKMLGWMMALALFSLAGIPPTAGFVGKLFLIMSGAGALKIGIILIVALNLVVSLYYYLRVVRAIFMERSAEPMPAIQSGPVNRFALMICALGIVLTGGITWLYEYVSSLV